MRSETKAALDMAMNRCEDVAKALRGGSDIEHAAGFLDATATRIRETIAFHERTELRNIEASLKEIRIRLDHKRRG